MYTTIDFESKKAIKQALLDGRTLTYYQPGPFGGNEPQDGTVYLEGPHYPRAHKWYAQATVRNGRIVAVK